MNQKSIFALLVFMLTAAPTVVHADEFDLTGTVLNGSNPFTFEHATLGTVTLTYSGSYKNAGLVTNWASITSIGLGELAGVGTLTVAWENPVASLDVRYYDLDLSERVSFTVPAGVGVALLADNPLDGFDFLDGTTLRSGAADLPNANVNNYALVGLAGDPFTTFTAGFYRPVGGGGSSLSFGNAQAIPTPAAATMGLIGLSVIAARRRRD